MKRLYFVRHGQSEANKRHVFAGQIDTPLTAVGRAQARAAGLSAKKFKFDLIVSSPLVRALETAQIIADTIGYPRDKIIVNEIFKEHYIGSLAGKPWRGYEEFDKRFPDMESWETMLERAKSGLEFLKMQTSENILLVGHGSFSRALRTVIDPSQIYDEQPNAKVVQLI